MISPHFTFGEFTVTNKSIPNVPSEDDIARGKAHALAVVEPLRQLWGGPIKVISWFRSPAVNRAVDGSPTSQHMFGEACDIVPPGDLAKAWALLVSMRTELLQIDQAIVYQRPPGEGWIHVSSTSARPPRRQFLVNPSGKPKLYVPHTEFTERLVL